jgi:hypothetical protein
MSLHGLLGPNAKLPDPSGGYVYTGPQPIEIGKLIHGDIAIHGSRWPWETDAEATWYGSMPERGESSYDLPSGTLEQWREFARKILEIKEP